MLACIGPHVVSRLLIGRSRWPRRFLRSAAWIAGARIDVAGRLPRPHSLLLCNHVSWLDILVMASATGCRFVSKDTLGHPLVHWLADQNGTIYVKRTHKRGSKDQALAIAAALDDARPVALFPEGTIGGHGTLLPFRSTLLEAAFLTARPIEVRPVAIDYGDAGADLEWHGESGVRNGLKVLGRRGAIRVKVALLDPLEPTGDRKQLAHEARERVAAALGASSSRSAGL